MKSMQDFTVYCNYNYKKRDPYPASAASGKAVTSYDDLPVALNAKQVAAVLGISRAGAYNLMRSEGFPTLFIGKRMVVPRDRLLDWMNRQVSA